MNERGTERLGPKPKLDTIVEEAIDIAKNFDTGRAVAYIVENTDATEERYATLAFFAKTMKPSVVSRSAFLRSRGISIEELHQHGRAAHLGEKAVKTVFDDPSQEQ